jgi:hypothetical protein
VSTVAPSTPAVPQPRGATGPAEIDIHDSDYCALNCRAGIVAAILRERWSIDVSPLFFRLAIAASDILGPMERGEIAGATFGAVDDATWAELFGAELVVWRPSSPEDMLAGLTAAMDRDGMVLAPHDGFHDPLATDKFGVRHMTHNTLFHGVSDDGRLRAADRGHRTLVDPADLWPAMSTELSSFVVVRRARPFDGDWSAEAARGTAELARALADRSLAADAAQVADSALADRRAPLQRWGQTHLFLLGIGRSRALFGRALRSAWDATAAAPPAGADLPAGLSRLSEALERASEAWAMAGRRLYKSASGRGEVDVDDLAGRLDGAARADQAAADALHAVRGGGLPW